MSGSRTPGRGADAPPEAKRQILALLNQARDEAERRAGRRSVLGREALPILEDDLRGAMDGTLFERAASWVNLGLYRGTYDIDPEPGDRDLEQALIAVDEAWERSIFDRSLVEGDLWL